MIPSDEIKKIVEKARLHTARLGTFLGPTVIAGALVLHTARYLEEQTDTNAHPRLTQNISELKRIGEELWSWRV